MGSWWRSEDMTYVSLIMSEEVAPACIRELGVLGAFQFSDLSPELTPFQRRYVSYIKRCDEIERKIRYVHGEAKKLNIPVDPAGSVDAFVQNGSGQDNSYGVYVLESLESKLDTLEHQLVDLNKFSDKLSVEYQQKVEFHHLLHKSQKFVESLTRIKDKASGGKAKVVENDVGITMSPLNSNNTVETPAVGGHTVPLMEEMSFANIAGVVNALDKNRFERMLFRATRGNCYIRFSALSGRATDAFGNHIDKVCFIIFYKSESIESKIKKICDAFNCNRYVLPDLNNSNEMELKKQTNHKEMTDVKTIIDKNVETRQKLCLEASKSLEEWLWIVRREKGIYHTLNLFKNDVAGNLLRGRAWVLTSKMSAARSAIKRAHSSLNVPNTSMLERVPENWPTPPTHFNTNKYTVAFQEFVNTYGVPRYKEANPALFTAATFPFFFGVMYGDSGHGSVLALFGLFLILTEHWVNNRMSDMASGMYTARYMLFAMGIMSIYAGLIYNDYFSLGLNLFGSRYAFVSQETGAKAVSLFQYGDANFVYPFGIDPAWHISGNQLLFFNSMKMKMSVILGIFQMSFGILLRGMNSIYFRSWLDFICEFLPMIIFDISFFGYMVILIFVKWSIDWNHRMALGSCAYDINGVLGACQITPENPNCYSVSGNLCNANTPLADVCPLDFGGTGDGCQPPNLITTLINVALKPGYVEEPMYSGQAQVQTFILLVAFICVPWLLIMKPMYLKYSMKANHVENTHGESNNPLLTSSNSESANIEGFSNPHGNAISKSESHNDSHDSHDSHEEHNFGEIVIHQAIETIEFVLGMVSNTASYLRLWALSLAHTELAHVFWSKAMLSTITSYNPVLIFMGYGVFAAVTFGVLLAMDVLECFLHALRLHWVEFQSKFFKADGYRFQPFDFRAMLEKTYLE